MSDLFPSSEELEALTGYKPKHFQRKWLTRKKLPYMTAADGKPRVLQQSLLIRLNALAPSVPEKTEPQLRF